MGFWHPTASTQHFEDDATWLLPTPSSNKSRTQIPLCKTPPSPNNSQHIMKAAGVYPPPPIFGVEVNFLTSALRNYHYADSPGSIFCSKWLKHHWVSTEQDPQHLSEACNDGKSSWNTMRRGETSLLYLGVARHRGSSLKRVLLNWRTSACWGMGPRCWSETKLCSPNLELPTDHRGCVIIQQLLNYSQDPV